MAAVGGFPEANVGISQNPLARLRPDADKGIIGSLQNECRHGDAVAAAFAPEERA